MRIITSKIKKIAVLNLTKEQWNYGAVYLIKGDTFPVRQILSDAGFKWSGYNKAWWMNADKFEKIYPTIKEKLERIGIYFGSNQPTKPSITPENNPVQPPMQEPLKQAVTLKGEEYPLLGEYNKESEAKTRKRYHFPIEKNILQFQITFNLKDSIEKYIENVIVNRYFRRGKTSDTWKITFNAEYADFPLYELEIGKREIDGSPILKVYKSFKKDNKMWGTYDEKELILNVIKPLLESLIPQKYSNNFAIEYDYRKREPKLKEFLQSIKSNVWEAKHPLYRVSLNSGEYKGEYQVTVHYDPPLTVEGYPFVEHPKAPVPGFKQSLFEIFLKGIHTLEELDGKIKEELKNPEVVSKYIDYLDSFPYVDPTKKSGYENYVKILKILENPRNYGQEVLNKLREKGYIRENLRAKGTEIPDSKKILDDLNRPKDTLDPFDYLYTLVAYQIHYYYKRYHERSFVQLSLTFDIYRLIEVIKRYGDIKPIMVSNAVEQLGDWCYSKIFNRERTRNTWENYRDFYSGFWNREQQTSDEERKPIDRQTASTALQMLKELAEINGIQVMDITKEAKSIYRQLALKIHPDKHPEAVEEYTEQFKALGAIWDNIPDEFKIAFNWYRKIVLAFNN